MMFSTTRRDFFIAAGGGVAAASMKAGFLNAAQVPGQSTSETAGWQEGNFSNVMAIAAHPGDAFFAMGAPVAVAANSGGPGSLLSLSLGEKGSRTIPAERYGLSQQEAAQKGAEMLGAKVLFLHYPDGEIPVNEEAKFAVCDFIRQYKPLTIVTHWKGSWHKDHRACYDIVDDAIFYAGLPALVRKDPAHEVKKLLFADNWEDATGFIADTYLDITSVFDRWVNACSTFPMWRGETGFRYNDYYGSLAIARGCLSNFKRAVALMSPTEQRVQHIRTP
jgi:LmbE family N-acetylglucosaminyl deacetylase